MAESTNDRLKKCLGEWLLLDSGDGNTQLMVLDVEDVSRGQRCVMRVETAAGGIALLNDVSVPEEVLIRALDNTPEAGI